MHQKSTSAVFLVWFCSAVAFAEPANGSVDLHVPDGCALLSSELHCALFVRRVSMISDWLVGWQVGLAAGRPACLSAMSATLDVPSSVCRRNQIQWWQTHGNKLLMLCRLPICLLCQRCFLFLDLIESVCVYLTKKAACLYVLLSVSISNFLPPHLVSGSIYLAVITPLSSSRFSVHQSTLIYSYFSRSL